MKEQFISIHVSEREKDSIIKTTRRKSRLIVKAELSQSSGTPAFVI